MDAEQIDALLRELFDADYYRAHHLAPDDPRDPLEVFRTEGGRLGHRPSARFDPAFYVGRYQDARESKLTPLEHYIRKGRARGYAPTRFASLARGKLTETLADGALLGIEPIEGEDEAALAARIEAAFERYMTAADADPALDPSPAFSTAFYLERYPDVRKAGEHPLVHYLRRGRMEGRQTSADVLALLQPGERTFDPLRPSALVCLHELSLSGAPIVGIDLIEALAEDHNVFCLSRHGGDLEPRLAAATVRYALESLTPMHFHVLVQEIAREAPVAFALVNSVSSWQALPALNLLGAPILTLIHEYADYILPRERVIWTALLSDRLLFSSEAIAKGWRDAVEREHGFRFTHVSIRHQAPATIEGGSGDTREDLRTRLSLETGVPLEACRIVLGAGSVQLRKGSDLFIAAACAFDRLTREGALVENEPVLFLWVGGEPDREDFGFGIWLGQQLDRAPAGRVKFVPAGDYYRDLIEAADLLFLPSRLDPFPNVIIDALCSGTPVLMFDDATGCPEALDRYGLPYLAADYGDVIDAARKIAEGLAAPPDRETLAARAREAFAFGPYVAAVLAAIDAVRGDRALAERDLRARSLDPARIELPFAGAFFGRGKDAALREHFLRRALHAGFTCFVDLAASPGEG